MAGYTDADNDFSDYDGDDRASTRRRNDRRERKRCAPQRAPGRRPTEAAPRRRHGPSRAARQGTEEFKCGHCHAFIGPTPWGGKHRNHCPLCLHSRHVDDDRPGDRASNCRASMAPVARFDRPGGEPVLVHRCLGCDLERHNRLAADDNLTLLMHLPLVAPRLGRTSGRNVTARDDGTGGVPGPSHREVS